MIRQAKPQDKPALKQIIDLSFPRFFRYFATHSINSQEGKVLVNETSGIVVGFAKLIDFTVAKQKYGCILWLAVHPEQRRKGTALELVEGGTKELKTDGAEAVFASVQRTNKASLGTFRKAGFRQVGFFGLWHLFSWRIFQFYGDIWFAPGEIALMHR